MKTNEKEASTSAEIPVVFLPSVEHISNLEPVDDGIAISLIRRLIQDVSSVEGFAKPSSRSKSLINAASHATSLISATEPAQLDNKEISPETPAQLYFRIRTVATFSGTRVANAIAVILSFVLMDFASAYLSGTDLIYMLDAIGLTLKTLPLYDKRVEEPLLDDVAIVDNFQDCSTIWFYRWIVAHQLHALFNSFAAAQIQKAISFLEEGNAEDAVEHLSFATTLVEAFGPTRAYALCHPPNFYRTVLRQSMVPPAFPVPLSGNMHSEYRAYRSSVKRLLEVENRPIHVLVQTNPSLAFARERLLEADLADAERHVTLVWTMIGNDKSIVQAPRSRYNALTALRTIWVRREREFGPFVRYTTLSELDPDDQSPSTE